MTRCGQALNIKPSRAKVRFYLGDGGFKSVGVLSEPW